MECPILASTCFSKKDPDLIIASVMLFCLIGLYNFINSFQVQTIGVHLRLRLRVRVSVRGRLLLGFLDFGLDVLRNYLGLRGWGQSHFVMLQYFAKCTAHPLILRMAQITGLCHHEIFTPI